MEMLTMKIRGNPTRVGTHVLVQGTDGSRVYEAEVAEGAKDALLTGRKGWGISQAAALIDLMHRVHG